MTADVGVDRGPAPLGLALSALAALSAAVVLATSGRLLLGGVTMLGGALLVTVTAFGRRTLLDVAALVMLTSVVFAGLVGAFPGALLAAAVGTVVAWDTAEHAISVGEQLGRTARAERVLVVHVAGSTAVGVGAAAVGYGIFLFAGGGRPASTVVLLLLGAVFITWALRQ